MEEERFVEKGSLYDSPEAIINASNYASREAFVQDLKLGCSATGWDKMSVSLKDSLPTVAFSNSGIAGRIMGMALTVLIAEHEVNANKRACRIRNILAQPKELPWK